MVGRDNRPTIFVFPPPAKMHMNPIFQPAMTPNSAIMINFVLFNMIKQGI
jgi:hypothetical protein